MIQAKRKVPKKPVKVDLEKLVKEQQELIKAQQEQLELQDESIQFLQGAIDDIILAQMNLEEGI